MFANVKDFVGFDHCALPFWHHHIYRRVRITETKEDKLLLDVAFCVMAFATFPQVKSENTCLIQLFKQTHVRSLAIKRLTILVFGH